MTSSPTSIQIPAFLDHGGEMGERMRAFDWSTTSLGHPDEWPQSLRTSVSILLNSKFPMFMFWGKDLICFYNDAFRPSLGNEGKHPWALGAKGEEVWTEIWDVIKPWIDQVILKGESIWLEDQLVPFYRDGKIDNIYWTFSYSPIYDESGGRSGVFVACHETTQHVLGLELLKKQSNEFRSLIMQAPVPIAVFRGETFIAETANDAYLEIVAKPREEFVGYSLFESLPEIKESLEPIAREVVRSGTAFKGTEFLVPLKRNNEIEDCYFNFVWAPFFEDDGKVNGFIVVAHEVTEHVIARKKLEKSEQRVRSLIESAPFPIGVYIGHETRIELANQSIIDIYGKGQEVIGKTYREILPELGSQHIFEQIDGVLNTGIPFHAKNQRVDIEVDGRLQSYYFNYSFTPLIDADGKVYGVMNTGAEVTDLVIAKQKVEETQSALQSAVELAELGTWDLDFINPSICLSDRIREWFGLTETENPPELAFEQVHERDKERLRKSVADAAISGDYEEEFTVIAKDTGRERVLKAKGRAIFDETGVAVKLSGTAQDITQQKRLQQELERMVKLRTEQHEAKNRELERSNANLEEFAYAASHDLKEPIRKIHFFTEKLKRQLDEQLDENQKLTFTKIETASKRMQALIEDLLLYSHVDNTPFPKEDVDLNEKLEKVMDDLDLHIQEKKATIEVGEMPVLHSYRRQIQQLFQNLISNAIKYSKPGEPPHVVISAKMIKGKDAGISMADPDKEKSFHLIEVKDNGIGFPQDDADRIFQVFQRLHVSSDYQGTGIGLSIAKKVVENHKGFIYATSKPGQGSTFHILFPVE